MAGNVLKVFTFTSLQGNVSESCIVSHYIPTRMAKKGQAISSIDKIYEQGEPLHTAQDDVNSYN